MPSCSAVNCVNNSRRGFRLFRFPADRERRIKWLINCKRDDWSPTASSRLCEAHFEKSQFEERRADGRILLKNNAVPTIFQVPMSSKSFLKIPRKT